MAKFEKPLEQGKISAEARDQIKDSITHEISHATNRRNNKETREFLSDITKLASLYLDYRANIPKNDILPPFFRPVLLTEVKLKQECEALTKNYSPNVAKYMIDQAITTVDSAIDQQLGTRKR